MAAPQRSSSTCPPLLPVDHRPAMVPLPCEAAADPPPAAATNIIANKTARMSRSPRQGRDERRGQRRAGAPRQRAVVVLPRMEAGPKIAEDATREQSHRAGLRSEENTSELQSLMHNSYAVSRLKKQNKHAVE